MQNAFLSNQHEILDQLIAKKADLLPILGAGLSTPLGVPSWLSLKTKIIDRILQNKYSENWNERDPQAVFSAAADLDPVQYRGILQTELTGLEGCSTLSLTAVARLPVPVFASTNLDNHLEHAFQAVGKILLPGRMGTAADIPRLRALKKNVNQPVFMKLHGTLDNPTTWIMNEGEYFEAYKLGSNIISLLTSGNYVPLFIGFSLKDYEIRKSLFQLKQSSADAFAIMKVSSDIQRNNVASEMGRIGIRIIPVQSYSEIPELLALIGDRQSSRIYVSNYRDDSGVSHTDFRLDCVKNISSKGIDLNTQQIIIDTFENAIDCLPDRDPISDNSIRKTGQKGGYIYTINPVISKPKNPLSSEVLNVIMSGLAYYPDFVVDRFLPDLMKIVRSGNSDLLWEGLGFLDSAYNKMAINGILPKSAPRVMNSKVISSLLEIINSDEFKDYNFQTRKTIIRYVSKFAAHPCCYIPPKMTNTDIGSSKWSVMKYLVCRHQIGKLSADINPHTSVSDLENKNPAKPFTLEALPQVEKILSAFTKTDPTRGWTLLTAKEWQHLATNSGKSEWPWGNEQPSKGTHAALRFEKRVLRDENGNFLEGSTEVGLFPAGQNQNGIFDLVGNVYDLTFVNDAKRLEFHEKLLNGGGILFYEQYFQICGGAWYFLPSRVKSYPIKNLYLNPKFGRNIGLRLAYRQE